jgi:hypothetical protein
LVQRSGTKRRAGFAVDAGFAVAAPPFTAAIAGFASGSIFTNHCSLMRGSITVPERSLIATECSWSVILSMRPRASRSATTRLRASSRERPA